MSRRISKKPGRSPKRSSLGDELCKALQRQNKSDLVEAIMELARADRTVMRRLESRFHVATPANELVVSTRQAIADATDFDERDINRNFDYDYEAYGAVKRNFGRLIELGCLKEAMDLSLEVMGRGSYQVEMSDEGLMTDEVEDCLQVVIDAINGAGLPPGEVIAWCKALSEKDRVGFICDKELRKLRSSREGQKAK